MMVHALLLALVIATSSAGEDEISTGWKVGAAASGALGWYYTHELMHVAAAGWSGETVELWKPWPHRNINGDWVAGELQLVSRSNARTHVLAPYVFGAMVFATADYLAGRAPRGRWRWALVTVGMIMPLADLVINMVATGWRETDFTGDRAALVVGGAMAAVGIWRVVVRF